MCFKATDNDIRLDRGLRPTKAAENYRALSAGLRPEASKCG